MNLCKKIIPLLFSISLFSCGGFVHRYDPVEAGHFVLDLESFRFNGNYDRIPPALHDPYLHSNVFGEVDYESRKVILEIPPSLDVNSAELTAEIVIRNIGISDDNREYFINEKKNWYNNNILVINKDLIGYTGDVKPYYELEYTIFQKKVLIPAIDAVLANSVTNKYPYHFFFNTSTPDMNITFNDDVNTSTLSETDFESNYSLSAPAIQAADYQFTVGPSVSLSEGNYSIRLKEGSCEATTAGYYSRASNLYTFAYDAAAPDVSAVAGTFSLSGSNFSPAVREETLLQVSFDEATDSLTPREDLEYKICYSTTISKVQAGNEGYMYDGTAEPYFLPVNGKEWFSFESPVTISYNDFPEEFKSICLYNTQQINFNVMVRDNCHDATRSSVYNNRYLVYSGPNPSP